MGILGDLKSKAKGRAEQGVRRILQKVAASANIPMNMSREEKDRAEIEAARAQGAPSFGAAGVAGWMSGRDQLKRLGVDALGMLQARWTDSELQARELVTAWAAGQEGQHGRPPLSWQKAGDVLLSAWQERGVEVAAAWQATFDALVRAWEEAATRHAARVDADGWRQSAADFDRIWQSEWERLQKELQGAATRMKASVGDARGVLGDGLPERQLQAWAKAATYLENTILRAEAELWGVWGTNGARIRGVSRTVTEARGTAEAAYAEVFDTCRKDFELGFAHTLTDFQTSWKNALTLVAEAT